MKVDAVLASVTTATVVAYQLPSPISGYDDVFVQRYAADGSKIGEPIQVNTTQRPNTSGAVVSTLVLSAGGFVVAANGADSSDTSTPFPSNSLTLQQFGSDGSKVGPEILLGPNEIDTTAYQAAALNNGGFAYTLYKTLSLFDERYTAIDIGFVAADGTSSLKSLEINFPGGDTPFSHIVQNPPTLLVSTTGLVQVVFVDKQIPGEAKRTVSQVYDVSGDLLVSTVVDFDGSQKIDRYGADGTRISETSIHDGLREEQLFNVIGKSYASQDAVYDSAGKLISLMRNYANGAVAFQEIVAADGSEIVAETALDGTRQTSYLSSTGSPLEVDRFDAEGHKTSVMLRSSDGSQTTTTYDPLSGSEVRQFTRFLDGSRVESNFAVTGQPYAEQTASFDRFGHLTNLTRSYANGVTALEEISSADGTKTVSAYDISHRLTSSIAVSHDGSRDVSVLTYVGSSSTPVTLDETRYGANNEKLSTDSTRPDGSHRQTAFASGVTLTSTAIVPDSLTGFSKGGGTFAFRPAFGQDMITNFHAGSGAGHDVIDLSAFHVQVDSVHSAASLLAEHLAQQGGNAVLTVSPTDVLTLKNTLIASLTTDNVVF